MGKDDAKCGCLFFLLCFISCRLWRVTIFIFGDAQMCWVFFNLGGGVVVFALFFWWTRVH